MVKRSSTVGAWTLGVLSSVACGDDVEPNVLPTTTSEGNAAGSTAAATTAAVTTATATTTTAATDGGPVPDVTAGTTAGDPAVMLPATYRFDCLDVIELGDSDGDGQADGNAFQAVLLEDTWMDDIAGLRLNVLLTVQSRDEAGGSAELRVGSGVGSSETDLCVEPSSASEIRSAAFDAEHAQWQPSNAAGVCAEPAAAGGVFGGTYTLSLGPSDTIYIYAEEDDGTALNCVPGGVPGGVPGEAPNAVPLRAIQATITVDGGPDEAIAAGRLTGCLLASEAEDLCSCLGDCQGSAFPPCAGCPDGSVPLSDLLGTIGPTNECTATMGATAYGLTVGFTAHRLGVDEPVLCGG
ncbi:hypothetical protein [Paraliomyxa miuraensis]|uniref:hypothetical protein n=1 Tax=Paraliomyxa miuraensis TaxID=376150 RepID=UPI002256B24B|nr:hypothetical protein [Paraliomyxa miuraensis]MCX4242283.1 hypothetical protein [Paraliomyxa miuraensis]